MVRVSESTVREYAVCELENLQSENLLFTVCKSVNLCLPTRGRAKSYKPVLHRPRVRLITTTEDF